MTIAQPADRSPIPQAEAPRDCPLCPRLVAFRHECRAENPGWWNAPVPAFGDPEAWLAASAREVTRMVHDLVAQEGGSISAEHGIGRMKRSELARTAQPARLAALAAIKRALDPAGIMNPGKLLPDG